MEGQPNPYEHNYAWYCTFKYGNETEVESAPYDNELQAKIALLLHEYWSEYGDVQLQAFLAKRFNLVLGREPL